ncbi:hypothetical protein C8Q72DRAFT_835597 [Fomitopsis betulina]|nr:hypothetical protein C8Q72DRAFT_835597 [Fomitopsis betulina]
MTSLWHARLSSKVQTIRAHTLYKGCLFLFAIGLLFLGLHESPLRSATGSYESLGQTSRSIRAPPRSQPLSQSPI